MRKGIKRPGIGSGGWGRLKTHCSNGHELTEENIWRQGNNRRCRRCSYDRTIKNRGKLKSKVMTAYGGKCQWPGCEITDIDVLTIDHVNDDGALERTRKVSSGHATYHKAVRENFPDKYQILCANHNLKKQILLLRSRRGV